MSDDFQPGMYRHYKGETYYAWKLVYMHDSRRPYVEYQPITGPHAGANECSIRPLNRLDDSPEEEECWMDSVSVYDSDGELSDVPRFSSLTLSTPSTTRQRARGSNVAAKRLSALRFRRTLRCRCEPLAHFADALSGIALLYIMTTFYREHAAPQCAFELAIDCDMLNQVEYGYRRDGDTVDRIRRR